MFISELEDLEEILDKLVFEDEPSIFTEEYIVELFETAFHLMEEYIQDNPDIIKDECFHEILFDELNDIFNIQFEDHFILNEYVEDDLEELLEDAFNIFINTFYPDKFSEQNIIDLPDENEKFDLIEKKIQVLRDIPQPVQRTSEWYQFRWNLITASNAWKAFETQSAINQLIYEKCQPIKTSNENCDEEVKKIVNINTPMHWGQKYEPLSVILYEQAYNTKVEDFGCIKHSKYSFLGASPDGIIVNKDCDRYGRMLEIKNVVSREITGIPKKEYWVQMQLQMEVCDLDNCDFLETKFVEYPDSQSFYNDTTSDTTTDNITITKDGKKKGIILHFHTKDGAPFYDYKPLNITSSTDVACWEETEIEKYESEPYNHIFMKFIYWRLDVFSCILVLRNREWFQNNIGQLEKVWKIIEEERITGYEHRAPNRKPKKEIIKPQESAQGCLLKFNKIMKVD
jgi:putative phage-type endonuclease